MDPNACLERFLDALEDNDWREAFEARRDLTEWLAKGGFEPDWSEHKPTFDGFTVLPTITSVGCYPLVYCSDSDCFCNVCAMGEGFTAEDGQVHWEGRPIDCDVCGDPIESAYGFNHAHPVVSHCPVNPGTYDQSTSCSTISG